MDSYAINGHTPQGWRIVRRPSTTGPAFPDVVAFVPDPEVAGRIVRLLNVDEGHPTFDEPVAAEDVQAGGPLQPVSIVPSRLAPDQPVGVVAAAVGSFPDGWLEAVVGSVTDLERPAQPPLNDVPPLDDPEPWVRPAKSWPPLDLAQAAPPEPEEPLGADPGEAGHAPSQEGPDAPQDPSSDPTGDPGGEA